MSRTKKTARNSIVGLACTVISSILSFVLQAVFIRLQGVEYSGINGLFTSIINILNLANMGTGTAISFRLYKAINENNVDDIELYLSVHRKLNYIIGTTVLVLGLLALPFLDKLVKEKPTFDEPLWAMYVLVLGGSVVGYFVNYKGILISAKQDNYIITIIQYITLFIKHGLQILILVFFKNIYLYLGVTIITALIQGIWVGYISKVRYNTRWKSNRTLTKEQRSSLAKDIGALGIYKVCRTLDANIDTFIISKFVSITTTAIYGSISMLLSALNELLGVFNDGMYASVGDLNAAGDKERLSQVFYQSFHFTFLIYGIATSVLVPFLSEFTKWWITFTLPTTCIYIMLLNFLMYGFGMNVATFRNTMGIFKKGYARPAFTAIFNLFFSYFLARRLGLIGTLLGTLFARVLTLVWYDPWLVIRQGFGKSPLKYFLRYLLYLVMVSASSSILIMISKYLPEITSLTIAVINGVIYFVASTLILLIGGAVFPEHKAVIYRILSIIKKNKG